MSRFHTYIDPAGDKLSPEGKQYLLSSSRSGKQLAAAGFIVAGAFLLMGLSAGWWVHPVCYHIKNVPGLIELQTAAFPVFIAVIYLFMTAAYFFSARLLYACCCRICRNIDTHDLPSQEESFGAMKAYCVFNGILLFLGLALFIAGVILLFTASGS